MQEKMWSVITGHSHTIHVFFHILEIPASRFLEGQQLHYPLTHLLHNHPNNSYENFYHLMQKFPTFYDTQKYHLVRNFFEPFIISFPFLSKCLLRMFPNRT
jgi:hypothetical protein